MSENPSKLQLCKWEKVELERDIIQARARGEPVQDTIERLGITKREYHARLEVAAKRAAKHISDETAVYLLNVLCRLDRCTHVVSQQVEAGDLRAANALANLVNSTANLVKVIIPQQIQQATSQLPNGELQLVAERFGISIPPPMLGPPQ
jgi:chromosome segregation ATPase